MYFNTFLLSSIDDVCCNSITLSLTNGRLPDSLIGLKTWHNRSQHQRLLLICHGSKYCFVAGTVLSSNNNYFWVSNGAVGIPRWEFTCKSVKFPPSFYMQPVLNPLLGWDVEFVRIITIIRIFFNWNSSVLFWTVIVQQFGDQDETMHFLRLQNLPGTRKYCRAPWRNHRVTYQFQVEVSE